MESLSWGIALRGSTLLFSRDQIFLILWDKKFQTKMRYSLGQDILNNMFLFFLIIITELQELPPVCVASLMDVLYSSYYWISIADGELFQLLSKCFHWRPFRMVLLKFPWDVQSNSHVMEWKNIKWINFDRANWTSFREDDNDNSSTPSNTNIS